jgi:hypothetical protein
VVCEQGKNNNFYIRWRLSFIVTIALAFPSLTYAGTWVAYGPQSFVRTSRTATTTTVNFSVSNPNTLYYLRLNNGGINAQYARSTGVITLNGTRILGPLEFNTWIAVLDWPILLRTNNQLTVDLRGTVGSGVVLQVIGFDFGAPTINSSISPPPNAAGWNNSNVTVSFTCADKISGVASCPAPIAVSSDGASQVITGTAVDKAGNKATTSVTVNLDTTPPVISGSIDPPPDAGGWNTPPVSVGFTCSDALSGMASCSPAVSIASEGAGQVVPGVATDLAGNVAIANVTVNISTNYFQVQNYGGKCLDYGPVGRTGALGVFLNDCAVARPIRVEEINDRHEVILHADNQVIGVHYDVVSTEIGAPPPPPATELALELQAPAGSTTLQFAGDQTWSLDGDSIILARTRSCLHVAADSCPSPMQPELTIEIQNAHGANYSPLVAGVRHLADNEFWDFNSSNGVRKYPTSGFIDIATNSQLWDAICASPQTVNGIPVTNAYLIAIGDPNGDPTLPPNSPAPCNTLRPGTWGRVFVVSSPNECSNVATTYQNTIHDVGSCIDLTNYAPLILADGITLRGNRRGINFGPQLFAAYDKPKNLYSTKTLDSTGTIGNCPWCMLQIHGDYARITGLRLRGPTRTTDKIDPTPVGIQVDPIPFQLASTTQYFSMVDHNDISDWVDAGIWVEGGHAQTADCSVAGDDQATLGNLRIERNFIHNNERQDSGYGTELNGGRALVSGNTFLMNRHAIAGGGDAHESYRASYNLVLSNAPLQYDTINYYTHDFDMHGTDGGFGGTGGYLVDIVRNTFLGTNRRNFEWRGVPCQNHEYRANVSLETTSEALNFKTSSTQFWDEIGYINIEPVPYQFQHTNPTNQIAVGDFDHDGLDDVFLATGAAWYYAPAANAEWRFLSAKTETLDQLLFGDFDRDGRTDVVSMQNGQFLVSWGGISDWEVLNSNPTGGQFPMPASTGVLVVGDFDGDGYSDIFYADGLAWWVSYGGNGTFVPVNHSSFTVSDLRFGDFDGDGTTDVFGVVANTWSYSKSATDLWEHGILQQPALTATVDGLVVADFDGDGRADIGKQTGPDAAGDADSISWSFSFGGTQPWSVYSNTSSSLCGINAFVYPQLLAGVGHFKGNPNSDLLIWGDGPNNFCLLAGGTGPAERQSRQDMR